MGAQFKAYCEDNGGKAGQVFDLSRFACRAFAGTDQPDATGFMAALGQAVQLVKPDVIWVDLLHLAQLANGGAMLADNGAGALRSYLEVDANVSAIGRQLVSVLSASRAPIPVALNLGSPADWMRFYGEEPGGELDDLDSEDVLVFLTNALQRLDLSEIGAVSVDASHPIDGDFAEICDPVANFASHQGLDLLIAKAKGERTTETMSTFELSDFADEGGPSHAAWRIDADASPDRVVADLSNITEREDT